MPLRHPLLVPGIRLRGPDPEGEAARALERARQPWVAGFCLFGGEAEGVRRLIGRLREIAGRPIFVASDMECGAGQQVAGLRRYPEAGVWGVAATPEEVENFGAATAADARSVGVDVVFAPVLDVSSEIANPIVGPRAFGWDPVRVAALGTAFARGVIRGGALPVVKHFPGHGATLTDSHDDVPVVRDSERRLGMRDLLPFAAALGAGVAPGVMTAHVVYPALDPDGVIATFSKPILDRIQTLVADRDDVVVITDALLMAGACGGLGEVEAARRALEAGCDLLLCPEVPEDVAAGLDDVDAGLLYRATERAQRFHDRLARAARDALGAPDAAVMDALAHDVAARAVAMAWGGPPERRHVLVLDDDDVRDRGALLSKRAQAAGVAVDVVRLPTTTETPTALAARARGTVVTLASVRASKGTLGRSPRSHGVEAALRARVLDGGGPIRFVWMGTPGGVGEVHVPGTGPEVERALARHLLDAPGSQARGGAPVASGGEGPPR